MLFRIDRRSSVPLFEQIVSQLRLAIAEGELRLGERLPSAGELANALGMNGHTVLHAYQVLRDEGVIELRRGRGAVVIREIRMDEHDVRAELANLAAAAKQAGLSTESAVELLRAAMETEG
ncbi:MAG: GntR family transcriptional regulator [Propionibacteriaceae bacterium]|nr:GntR family transcriptional regulator [Propionibacteriaceae bacterium]